MGVEAGYKMTNIGIIPKEWNVDFISNHALICTGSRNTQDRIDDGTYPFFVRSSTVERINNYSFDGEAVLTAGDGVRTGKVFHYINGKFDFHQRVYKISDFSEELDGYFFYLVFSKNFYNRIMSMTAKSSVDSVRMNMISKMEIPIPAITEQHLISDVIRDINKHITSLDHLIAKKRDIKKGAMQQLLTGKKRLPGYNANWEEMKIGDIFDITAGGDYNQTKSSNNQDSMYRFPIYSNSISNESLYGYCNYCDHKAGSITITARGTLGVAAYRDHPFTAIGRVLVLTPKFELDGRFCAYFINGEIDFVRESTGVPQLTSPQVSQYSIKLPPVSEQKEIANILFDMDYDLVSIELKKQKTIAIKRGLMQELLTGNTRLI